MNPAGKYAASTVAGLACLALTQLVWSASLVNRLVVVIVGLTGVALIVAAFWDHNVRRIGSLMRETVVVPMAVVGYFIAWASRGRTEPMMIDELAERTTEFQEQRGRVEEAFSRLIR